MPFDIDKMLLDTLSEEPGYKISDDFAERMAEKMNRRFAWSQYLHEFIVYLSALLGILGLSAVMALIWFDIDWKNWWNFLLSNASLVAGINLLAVFVLFTDKVLLRYFLFKSEKRMQD